MKFMTENETDGIRLRIEVEGNSWIIDSTVRAATAFMGAWTMRRAVTADRVYKLLMLREPKPKRKTVRK